MIKIDNKEYRNLEEQVLENMKDINYLLKTTGSFSRYGINIVGNTDSSSGLPDANSYEGNYGDSYLVGTAPQYHIWVFSIQLGTKKWLDLGQFPIEGPEGPQGETGPEGPQGRRGSFWRALHGYPSPDIQNKLSGDHYLDVDTGDVYGYDGSQWNLEGNIRGPEGPRGPQGPIGPQGIEGPQGPRGPQGITGETGLTALEFSGKCTLSEDRKTAYTSADQIDLYNRPPLVGDEITLHSEDGYSVSGTVTNVLVGRVTVDVHFEDPWLGPKGDKGDPGDQGPAGPAGPGIVDVEVEPSTVTETGNLYNVYYTVEGEDRKLAGDFEAPRGEKGPQGDKGEQGVSIDSVSVELQSTDPQKNNIYEMKVGLSDGTEKAVGTFTVNAGGVGPEGPEGPVGPSPNITITASVTESTGTPGVTVDATGQGTENPSYSLEFFGLKGETGPEGPRGVTGEQGEQGVSIQNVTITPDGDPVSIIGPQGETGAPGVYSDLSDTSFTDMGLTDYTIPLANLYPSEPTPKVGNTVIFTTDANTYIGEVKELQESAVLVTAKAQLNAEGGDIDYGSYIPALQNTKVSSSQEGIVYNFAQNTSNQGGYNTPRAWINSSGFVASAGTKTLDGGNKIIEIHLPIITNTESDIVWKGTSGDARYDKFYLDLAQKAKAKLLPATTIDDNGKVLTVVDGTWQATEGLKDFLPIPTAEDEGKVLKVVGGVPTWVAEG